MEDNLPFIRHQLSVLNQFETMTEAEREATQEAHELDTSLMVAAMESCLLQQSLETRNRLINWRPLKDCCPSVQCMRSRFSRCGLKVIPRDIFYRLAIFVDSSNVYGPEYDFSKMFLATVRADTSTERGLCFSVILRTLWNHYII